MKESEPIAVYVHTPFCPSKCGYCDFNSYAMDGEIKGRTSAATIREIEGSPWRGVPSKTVFFGGGTPTFLETGQLISLLRATLHCHPSARDAEITSEANPGTVDAGKFEAMREAGFNRLSLGAQSFFEDDLVALGRVHRVRHIERAVQMAREAGFENINVDLMFGLPGQTPRAWAENLDRAVSLGTDHLSLYGLTLEPNTPFYKMHSRGELEVPEDAAQVEMYELAEEKTAEAGFRQYEISNFAKPGFECRHNLCYWHNERYAGYGPGAVGFMPGPEGPRRYTNIKHPLRYCEMAERGAPVHFEEEVVGAREARLEKLMLGLRLNEGVPSNGLELRESAIAEMVDRGWVRRDQDRLALTAEGRHFCSEVTLELLR